MKIPLHHSLKVAHEVVRKIDLPKSVAKHVTIESWSNCREQGLCISVTIGNYENWKKIAVAEHRSSDSIIVASGPCSEFDNQTNQMSDKVWEQQRFFGYGKQDEAAEYIKKEINETYEH